MRVLRPGQTGEDVARWQAFLVGYFPYSEIVITGHYDDVTFQESKDFQEIFGLKEDGKIGNRTLSKALDNDFFIFSDVDEDDLTEFDVDWPEPPSFSPLNYQDRLREFGNFKFKHTPITGMPEFITITDNWQSKNIGVFDIPQLKGVLGSRTGKILLHKKAGDQFVQTFADWEDAGHLPKILGFAGSFVPRYIRGSRTTLSNHAHGTAIDINVPWNGLGRVPALKGKKGSVRELVKIANNNGLFWGGHFSNRSNGSTRLNLDGMHFEIAKVI